MDEDYMKGPYPAYEGYEPYIFVSYAHKDRIIVFPEIRKLQDESYPIWFDAGLTSGPEWDDEIEENIMNCDLFIVFISRNSMASASVLNEIKLALKEEIDIIPIYLEDTELPQDLRLDLSNKHAVSDTNYIMDCFEAFENAGIHKIKVRIPQKPIPLLKGYENTEESYNFDSLYNSVEEKFEEFDSRDYKEVDDIEKIESFLDSINDEMNLLRLNFSDEPQFQSLSDNIAKSVKGHYVLIINEADSFEYFDLKSVSRVFENLFQMAYTPAIKEEIQNNLEQLEKIMGNSEGNELISKMSDFNDNAKDTPIHTAKEYSNEMRSAIDNLNSSNKDNVSNSFAMSLDNYVAAHINEYEDNAGRLLEMKDDLIELLGTAERYARDADTKEKIEKDMKFLTDFELPPTPEANSEDDAAPKKEKTSEDEISGKLKGIV